MNAVVSSHNNQKFAFLILIIMRNFLVAVRTEAYTTNIVVLKESMGIFLRLVCRR